MFKHLYFFTLIAFFLSCADPAKWRTSSHLAVIDASQHDDSVRLQLQRSLNATLNKTTIVQNGWLIYKYGENLAFFPIKDQTRIPTYSNFLKEEKGDGQRMNNNYSAPAKLVIAKQLSIGVYDMGQFLGKQRFYIQPVKYTYTIASLASDTADYHNGVMGWTFLINGKQVAHNVFYFMQRTGTVGFLNEQDSLFAAKGGRNKTIQIYPPH